MKEVGMSIDWAAVDWLNLGVLAVFAFVASLIGGYLSFHNRFVGAILTAILFIIIFGFAKYYPHGYMLPGITPKPV
jgi:hypothetical protein